MRLRHDSKSEPSSHSYPSHRVLSKTPVSSPCSHPPVDLEHEPEYFASVEHLSDAQLAGFGADDLQQVRVAVSAYGLHIFGKVRIPSLPDDGPAFIHFRAFTGGPDDMATLHSIRKYRLLLPPPGGYADGLRAMFRYRGQGSTGRRAYLPCDIHRGRSVGVV